jgi:hypothetical protein
MSIPSTLSARISDVTRDLAADAATKLHTFQPAVMAPVYADTATRRIEAIRLKVADKLQEVRDERTELDRDCNRDLQLIRARDDVMEAVSASLAIAIDTHRQAEIVNTKQSTQADASVIAGVVDLAVTELNLVAAEVMLLPATGMASRQLKVTGASGVSKEEALACWTKKRNDVAKAWVKMNQAKEAAKGARVSLSEVPHTREEAKEKRASINDDEELADAMLLEIYSKHYGVGEEVHRDKETYEKFPLPKTLDSLNYDAFKKKMKTWMSRPSTIKKYYLILHDVDYSFDAVDAVRAMHLIAPDSDPTWNDPSSFTIKDEFKEAKDVQWRRLYKELTDLASEVIKTWMERMLKQDQGLQGQRIQWQTAIVVRWPIRCVAFGRCSSQSLGLIRTK